MWHINDISVGSRSLLILTMNACTFTWKPVQIDTCTSVQDAWIILGFITTILKGEKKILILRDKHRLQCKFLIMPAYIPNDLFFHLHFQYFRWEGKGNAPQNQDLKFQQTYLQRLSKIKADQRSCSPKLFCVGGSHSSSQEVCPQDGACRSEKRETIMS